MSKNTQTSGLVNYITYSGSNVAVSGSLTVTGSLNVTGGITGSFQGVATTASYVLNAVSASFATTASYAVSASVATNAVTASYALNAVSASFATSAVTASFANAFTVAGTLTATTLVVQTITSSVDFVTGSTRFGSLLANTHAFTGSVGMTGSLTLNNIAVPTSASLASTYLQLAGGTLTGALTGTSATFTSSSFPLDLYGTTNNYGLRINSVQGSTLFLYSSNANAASRNWGLYTNYNAYGDFAIAQSNAINGDLTNGANGTSRFYISNAGNVGIGTITDAGYTLDVTGTGRFSVSSGLNLILEKSTGAYLSFNNGSTVRGSINGNNGTDGINLNYGASHTTALAIASTGAATFKSGTTNIFDAAGTRGIAIYPSLSGTTHLISSDYLGGSYYPLAISARGNSADLYLNTNGNVGIGNTFNITPYFVSGQTGGVLQTATNISKSSTASVDPYPLAFFGSNDSSNPLGLLIQMYTGATTSAKKLKIQGTAIGISANDIVINNDGGNVGIGTAIPYSTAKLQVKTATDINIAVQTGTLDATGIKLNAFNDAGSANIPLELNGSTLYFKTGETERMRITSVGDICAIRNVLGVSGGTSYKNLSFGAAGLMARDAYDSYFVGNLYYDGSWKLKYAGQYGNCVNWYAGEYSFQTSTTNGAADSTTSLTATLFLDRVGNAVFKGTVTQNGSPSDINLKENLVKITSPLEKISQINGYNFDWKTGTPSNGLIIPVAEGMQAPESPLSIVHDAGLIAQEVEAVMPQLVRDNGHKALNYNGIIALLVEGIKEQQTQIQSLQTRITQLINK